MTPPYSPDRHHFPKTTSHSQHRSCLLFLHRTLSAAPSRISTILRPRPRPAPPPPPKTSTSPPTWTHPDSKRLRRMKDGLREMSLWCQQLMREEDLMEEDEDCEEQAVEEELVQIVDDTDQDFHDNATATAENLQDDGGKDFAESVSVEKKDDCLVIHFRCHCDKAYQFLLSGGDCYYKLM
ncbi:uncharacterized protein [Pyrus communis]|uniref:uncharacterized protein n=1 Tax=Pyrus communis TaxID=23211 RepID=UPI0035BF44BC